MWALSRFPLVNYLPVAPVHKPGCQLVNHVALVQLGSVDTEPMGVGCRKHTIHLDATEESPTGQAYLSRGLSSVGWEVLRITGRAPEAFPRPQSAFDVDRSQRTSSIGLVEGRGLFCGEFKVS